MYAFNIYYIFALILGALFGNVVLNTASGTLVTSMGHVRELSIKLKVTTITEQETVTH